MYDLKKKYTLGIEFEL